MQRAIHLQRRRYVWIFRTSGELRDGANHRWVRVTTHGRRQNRRINYPGEQTLYLEAQGMINEMMDRSTAAVLPEGKQDLELILAATVYRRLPSGCRADVVHTQAAASASPNY